MGLLMLEKFEGGCQLPGASSAEIAACEAKLKIILPAEIKAFLSASNGFNGEVGQGYLVLWSAVELSGADGDRPGFSLALIMLASQTSAMNLTKNRG